MTREEYQKKIDELNEQKVALNTQIVQVNKEFENLKFEDKPVEVFLNLEN